MKPSVVIHADLSDRYTFIKAAGIIEGLSPNSDVVSANLSFEEGNVPMVSAYLFTTVPFWPAGTVFLSFVGEGDPIALKLSNGTILLCPNNGTVSMSLELFGLSAARKLTDEKWSLAKAAASLLNGVPFEELGEALPLEDVTIFRIPEAHIEEGLAEGAVGMLLKTFGNITFTIKTDDFEKTLIATGDEVRVTISHDGKTVYEKDMTYQPSFGYVPVGDPVVFNGSSGYMDIGLNQDSFIDRCLPELLTAEDIGSYHVRIEKKGDRS
ncbi:MAG: SAM-dependent chlorinase/fluorinase [Erysipelotrichaceae bacterium]|nr:SAM-dependent chlorinase/fluorinase [Erysipelotrichaceae bacterium]